MGDPATLTDEQKQYILAKVFAIIQRQDFADWYGEEGRFTAWFEGAEDNPGEAKVKSDLAYLLRL